MLRCTRLSHEWPYSERPGFKDKPRVGWTGSRLLTCVITNWPGVFEKALAHATFEGLSDKALFLMEDSIPIDERQRIGDSQPLIMSTHLSRAAAVLLCIVIELQAYFRFDDDGARINERIREVWNVLGPVPEIKELYDERYKQLMEDKGINT